MEIDLQCSRDDFEITIHNWPETPDGKMKKQVNLLFSVDQGFKRLYDHHDHTRPVIDGANGHDVYNFTPGGEGHFIGVSGDVAVILERTSKE